MSDNKALLADEISVIESMYGSDAFHPHSSLPSTYVLIISKAFQSLQHLVNLEIWISFTEGYPSSDMPGFRFHEVLTPQNPISLVQRLNEGIEDEFRNLFFPGEVVLFSWFIFLEEYLTQYAPSLEDLNIPKQALPQKPQEEIAVRAKDEAEPIRNRSAYSGPEITSGSPIEDRKSVFIAHCAEVHSVEDVKKVIGCLLEDRKIAKATHNISAYRILNPDQTIHQGNHGHLFRPCFLR